jgi:hypothetical protein
MRFPGHCKILAELERQRPRWPSLWQVVGRDGLGSTSSGSPYFAGGDKSHRARAQSANRVLDLRQLLRLLHHANPHLL